ncbi:DEAD/DEAH box helicase [Actinoplanes solisilvae]|uniref:DEAD/DEAH box helicase n=1 Tax=Actinoplanes solisilvae TaxID=2486853 RepID=UPI0013E30D61|nr:AAA domain-containing protein [Actinoplanes solisilvae]
MFVSLCWELRTDPPEVWIDETEAILTRSAGGPEAVIEIGDARGPASGLTAEDEQTLQRLLAHAQERVAVVLNLDLGTGNSPWPRLDLNVYTYEIGPSGSPLAIGVADKELANVRRAAGDRHGRRSPEWALNWLTEKLVLPPLPGSPPGSPKRLIISAGPRTSSEEPVAFRVHGRGVAADVSTATGRTMLSRVVLRAHAAAQGPLKLIHRAVTFTDETQATQLREEMRQQLARLASGEGFLAMWDSYNRKESWWTHRTVRDAGYLTYEKVHPRADGVMRFFVTVPSGGRLSLLDRVASDDAPELEAGATLPGALLHESTVGDQSWGLLDGALDNDAVTGEVVAVNLETSTIDLRMTNRRGPAVRPPATGFLYLSFRGDRRRLLRRREAFGRILNGQTRIPRLLALLEGEPVPAPLTHKRIEPESLAAWECFNGGRPTPRQRRALDVALNTPDIAIIQGPPGTGKTQVIAALQQRLAESGREYARLRGSMLLTSYQHAAVDELVDRSVVFGLPANKVDRTGRGTTVQIDRWQEETVARLDDRLAQNSTGPATIALRRATAAAAGYLLAPTDNAGTVEMLRDLLTVAEAFLPGRLADRMRDRLAVPAARPLPASGSDAEQLAIRAVRGIPYVQESFEDGGPSRVAKAMRRLLALSDVQVPPAMLELLKRVVGWNEPGPPPFLAELAEARRELLELLTRPAGPALLPVVDPELRAILEEVVDALADRVARTAGDGVALALLEYREAIDGDPGAVQWTLREYTASYAATCQQVASPTMADAKGESRVDEVVFDTVIVDEAARANPLDLMIPLIHASRRIVFVGDHNQLPQMLEPDVEREFEPDMRELLSESLFELLFKSLDRPGVPVRRVVTLDTQFRMHRVLGDFVSRNFYRGGLNSARPDTAFAHGIDRYGDAVAAWLDVPPQTGPEVGDRSKARPAEASVLAAEVVRLLEEAPDLTVGVIAFYSAQVEEIRRQLAARKLLVANGSTFELVDRLRYDSAGRRMDRLAVGTVDAFQGREFDVVLLSTTRCQPRPEAAPAADDGRYRRWVARRYGHLTLRNRLCVAMSRQKRLLITVGAAAMFRAGEAPSAVAPLTDFLDMCERGAPHGRFQS